jgi:hypothetical protein
MPRSSIAVTLVSLTLVSLTLLGCKLPKHGPREEPATDLPARRPSPVSKSEDFAVDEDVSVIDDDDTFAIDGRVVTVTAAPKGYTVRMGTGRAAKTKAFPASRVFPAPWASAKRVRVGDTIYHVRRYGSSVPPKCIVEAVPADIHATLTAECEGAGTLVVARTEAFFAIEPATAANLSPDDHRVLREDVVGDDRRQARAGRPQRCHSSERLCGEGQARAALDAPAPAVIGRLDVGNSAR